MPIRLHGLTAQDRTPEEKRQISDLMEYNTEAAPTNVAPSLRSLMQDRVKDSISQSIINSFNEKYKNDDDYLLLKEELDIQGMRDLLDSDYIGTEERKRRLLERQSKAEDYTQGHKAALSNPFLPAYARGSISISKTIEDVSPVLKYKKEGDKDVEIREKLFAESQRRKELEVLPLAKAIYDDYINLDNQGLKSLSDTYKEFDTFANNKDVSPHYATFRNTDWLKDYSQTDRLKDFAQYQAMAMTYGEGIARRYLDRTIQNEVAKAQDGRWTGNTAKKIASTIVSDLGSNVGMISYIGRTPEEIGLINQGLNPIKDSTGKIVGSEPIKNPALNPAYWSDVYKYNTFSPDEIALIKERGGVSPSVNVREYGHIPDFFSWETAQEAGAQAGHIAAFGAESAITGGAGKLVGAGLKATLKGTELSAKALSKLNKAGKITNDLFVALSSSASAAQQEAMGAFDEQLQLNKEKIEAQKRKELKDFYNSIDYDTSEAKQRIEEIFDTLKRADVRRVKNAREGVTEIPLSDDVLKDNAKNLYTQELMNAKSQELDESHKQDELEAAKDAAIGYGTTFIMDWVKEAPFDLLLQKFKFSKGSLKGAMDNSIDESIIGYVVSGGIKRTGPGKASVANLRKEYGKLIGGGFVDEWLDGVHASIGAGVNSNEFDNYINRTYNPEAYNDAVDNISGSIISGLVSGLKGTVDRQNLYEGFIGAISPMASGIFNVDAAFHPKDTWSAITKGTDLEGNRLNFAERVSTLFTNPLLSTYAQLKAQDRAIDNTIDAVNNVISKNKDKLQDASELIYALNTYESPLMYLRVEDESEKEAYSLPSLLDSKDKKLYNAFTLIKTLDALAGIQGAEKSPVYQRALHTIEGLVNNSLSDEELRDEVEGFLANSENKSLLGTPEGIEEATRRLQKNARYFIDLRDKMHTIEDQIEKSPALKNVDPRVKTLMTFNLVASDDYKARLAELEKELGLTHTDYESTDPSSQYLYGTDASRKSAIAARERLDKKLQKQMEEIGHKREDIKHKRKKLEEESSSNENKEEIKKRALSEKALDFQAKTVEEQRARNNREIDDLKATTESPEFTEETLLNLDARTLAAMLDPRNQHNYSKRQQNVIEKVRKKLLRQNPEAMSQLRDAGILAERIYDLSNLQYRLNGNHALTAVYMDAAEQLRNEAAIAESLQQGIETHFSKIEKAFVNRFVKNLRQKDRRQAEFKASILNTGDSRLIEAYVEDHPEQAEQIAPYLDLLKLSEDVSTIVFQSDAAPNHKMSQLLMLNQLINTSETREEAVAKMEQIVDDTEGAQASKDMENILKDLETLGYQRDATVIQNRQGRKERQEREKEQRERDAQKALEEAKAEAEANAKTVANKPTASVPQDNEMLPEVPPSPEDAQLTFVYPKPFNWDTMSIESNEEPAPLDGEVRASTTEKDGVNVTSYTQYRATDKGEVKPVTSRGGLKIDGSSISKDSLKDAEDYEEIRLSELREKDGKFSGTIHAKGEDGWTTFDVVFDSDPRVSSGHPAQQNEPSSVINIKEDPDSMAGKSPSLEEEARSLPQDNKEGHVTENLDNVEADKAVGEQSDNSVYTLSGNSMAEYRTDILEENGVLEHKKGKSETDNMSKFYNWMNSAGIHLQNIIDRELASILKRNPHTKVRFMTVRPDNNATHDVDVQSHLFLVLDYDDNINKGITRIHSDSYGGVIKCKGKDYLIIGVVGYGYATDTDKRSLYNILYGNNPKSPNGYGLMKKDAAVYWKNNPTERFRVSEGLYTEIVPKSIVPGYVVRQLESDEHSSFRSISELLEDVDGKGRNPFGFDLSSLAWGIQRETSFFITGASPDEVMLPANVIRNLGNTFVLIPASNGKLLACYIKPLFYQELRDGELKSIVDNLLAEVVSPNYNTRLNALKSLSRIFYFDSENGDSILLRKSRGEISLVHDGKVFKTFTLDSSFDRGAFMAAMGEMNPRINITPSVLQSPTLLRQYDEAGALQTDLAQLCTAGSSYNIYALDASGNMMKPEEETPPSFMPESTASFKKNRIQVVYQHSYYQYDKDAGTYSLNGVPVTDSSTLEALEYNRTIIESGLAPLDTKGVWEYYQLGSSNSPVIIAINENTKDVVRATESQAQEILSKALTKQHEEERQEVAESAMLQQLESGGAGTEDVFLRLDPIEEEFMPPVPESSTAVSEQSPAKEEEKTEEKKTTGTSPSNGSPIETQSFVSLIRSKKHRMAIISLIKEKWPDAPVKVEALASFLQAHGVDVEAIGSSDEDIQAWIDTLRDCR